MPLWKLGDYNLGTVAAGIGAGIAGVYLFQKLIRKFKNDNQKPEKDKKPVTVQPTSEMWKHIDGFHGAETGTPVDLVRELPTIKIGDSRPPPSKIFAQCFKKAGDKLLKRRDYQEAIACYSDGASSCPEEETSLKARIYSCRSFAYQQLDDQENVVKDCTMSLKHYDGDQDVYLRRAIALLHFGKLQEALGDYAAVAYLVKVPDNQLQSKMLEISRLLAREKTSKSYQYHSALSPAKYVVKEYLDKFLNHPLKIIDDAVRDWDRALVLAHKEFLSGNILVTLDLDPREIVSSTNPYKYMLLYATAKFLNGATDTAMGILMHIDIRPICERDPLLSATVLIQTATLFYWMQQPEQAESYFDRALAIAPENTDVYFHRGEEYFKLGDYVKAIENYSQALRFRNDSIPAMTAKALALFQQGNESISDFVSKLKSEVLFQELIQKYSHHYMVHLTYAKVLSSQKNYEEAEKHFDEAHRLAPNIGGILVCKAEMYLNVEKDKAFEILERALTADYSYVKAYELIGYLYIDRNLPSKAVKMFNKGLPYVRNSEEYFSMHAMYINAKSRVDAAAKLGPSSSRVDKDANREPP